jgi:uncharacterized protein YlxP (DUF503 family)
MSNFNSFYYLVIKRTISSYWKHVLLVWKDTLVEMCEHLFFLSIERGQKFEWHIIVKYLHACDDRSMACVQKLDQTQRVHLIILCSSIHSRVHQLKQNIAWAKNIMTREKKKFNFSFWTYAIDQKHNFRFLPLAIFPPRKISFFSSFIKIEN